MKTCTRCGVEKLLTEFVSDKTRRDGLNPWCRACRRAYNKENRDRDTKTMRRYRLNNPEVLEKNRAFMRAYYRANRPAYREAEMRRKALQISATVGVVSYSAILQRDGYVCHICSLPTEPEDVHFDHVIPLSRGGAHSEDNIKVAHSTCNLRKGARLIVAGDSTDNVSVCFSDNREGGIMARTTTPTTKKCTRCSKRRKVENFYRDKTVRDGLSSWCKACCAAYDKAYAAKKRAEREVVA